MENISGSRCPLMTPLLGSQPQIAVEGTGSDGVVMNNVSPHDGGRLQQSTRAMSTNRRIGEAAVSLRRSSNGRFMSEQSLAVRETAAEHLEERQSDWAYSRPVVVLDLLWNLIFVVVAGVVLVIARTEKPPTPLRVWSTGEDSNELALPFLVVPEEVHEALLGLLGLVHEGERALKMRTTFGLVEMDIQIQIQVGTRIPIQTMLQMVQDDDDCTRVHVPGGVQVAFSTFCLGGEAKEWVLAEANAAGFEDIGEWAGTLNLKQFLKEHFLDKTTADKTFDKLTTIGQKHWTFVDSLSREVDRLPQVPGLNLQDNQVLYIYSRALPEPIRGQLVAESKSGTGKRILWRQKRQDHTLAVFDDDTVEKWPLEVEGVASSRDSGKWEVTTADQKGRVKLVDADGIVRGPIAMPEDITKALEKRELARLQMPKVEIFLFKGERVSGWLELLEQVTIEAYEPYKFKMMPRYVWWEIRPEVMKECGRALRKGCKVDVLKLNKQVRRTHSQASQHFKDLKGTRVADVVKAKDGGEVEEMEVVGRWKRKRWWILEGHNHLNNLKDVLASTPRFRDELKARLSKKVVSSLRLGAIIPKEAEWAETGTKMDWKFVACGCFEVIVKGKPCTAMDNGGYRCIKEEHALHLGMEIDRSDNGVLMGANSRSVIVATACSVVVEIRKVKEDVHRADGGGREIEVTALRRCKPGPLQGQRWEKAVGRSCWRMDQQTRRKQGPAAVQEWLGKRGEDEESVEGRVDTSMQEDPESGQKSTGECNRNSPRAFSALVAKIPESAKLRSGMIWKPWRTVNEVPYSILADVGVSPELLATTVAHIVTTGLLEGDEDVDANAYATDCERFYRSDASDCESWMGMKGKSWTCHVGRPRQQAMSAGHVSRLRQQATPAGHVSSATSEAGNTTSAGPGRPRQQATSAVPRQKQGIPPQQDPAWSMLLRSQTAVMDQRSGEADEAYHARMLAWSTETKKRADDAAAATKKKREDAEQARLLAIEQQRQHDEAAARAADEERTHGREKIFSGEQTLLTMAAEWRTEAENGKLEDIENKIALLLSHLTDLLATCITQQEDIHSLDDSLAQVQDRLRQLEQRPVAALDASSSNTSDHLAALEMHVDSLKDGVQLQQTATQQLEQRICTTANTSSLEPCETAPKFDGQEIFCDLMKIDPVPWFRKFELTLQLHNVKEHKHHTYLYSRSGGACQAWLDNLLSKYGVVAADLHTKISWDDLKAAWHKRFQVEPPEIKAMDKLMVFEQGTLLSTDWIAEYQRLTSVPDIQMGFKAICHYFISRSCPTLSNALTHVEDILTATAELFDKAAQIIIMNKEAKNLRSSAAGSSRGQHRPRVVVVAEAHVEVDSPPLLLSFEDYAARLVPTLGTQAQGQDVCAASSPFGSGDLSSSSGSSRDSAREFNIEVLHPLTSEDFAWLPLPTTGRLPGPQCAALCAHLHTYLSFYAPPTSPTDDEVAVGDILAYTTKVAREFRTQRYDDNNAPLMYVRIQVGQASCSTLLDSGASRNFMSQSVMQRAGLGAQVRRKANRTTIKLVDGKTQQLLDRYIEAVPVYFAPHACEPVTFDILDTDFDIVLGMPWLASADHTVNFHRRTLSVRDAFDAEVACTIPLRHPSIRCQVVTAKSFRATCAYEQPEEIGLCFLRTVVVADSSPTDLSSDPRVVRLLDEFTNIFESPTGVVPDRPISHEIILEAGVVPPKGCIYRMSEEELEVLRAQLDDLLDKGWIRPSSSPYGASVLFVRKKNKDLRLSKTPSTATALDGWLSSTSSTSFPITFPGSRTVLRMLFSRCPDHCTAVYSTFEIDDDLRNNFIRGYRTDAEFHDKYANCSSPNLPPSQYRIQEGYLLVHTRGKDLLCVPSDPHLRTRLLGEFHDAPATGHFGVNRTIDRLWWPGLLGDVTCYCESCEVCRRCKSRNHRPYGELRPLPVPLRRREAIAMDITGPFPKHKTGVDGILTVVDGLTKIAMFLPCRYHAKSPELAEVLYAGWIRTKGYLKEIVCDRDTRFMSDFWLALIKRWGSSLKPSSTRHPQTDGQTERAHQTAQVLLRTLIRPDQKDWVERLPDVELAYNSSIHPAIGMSPFEFEHGSSVTSPLDSTTPRTAESDDHFLFLHRMQELLVKACDQMAKMQQRMSQQANRRCLPCAFRAGDLGIGDAGGLREDNLPFDIVLGIDWGEAVGATLHLIEHECRLPSPLGGVKTARLFHVSGVDNSLAHCCLSAPAFARLVKEEQLEEQVFVAYVRPVTEPKEEKPIDSAIAKLLEEYVDLAKPPAGVVPWPIQHRIEIEPCSRTHKGAVYRMSPRELEELRKQLDELLEKGWIRPSSSPFGAPVLFVPKKEGELRMCIDYRGLNAIIVKNTEPLPPIDDLSDRVQGCKYFSKIDLKCGYHQIEVHPDDQYKTAFRTRYGHYEFIVMPFGLTIAPTTFQRCMNDLFRPWLDRFVVVYLDDILVFSRTLQEHEGHLRQVLERLREANFKINAKKCEWAKTQVLYLGHVLDGDDIKPEDSKIAAIRDWPTPRTLTELRSFLGLANYYRKFVRNFSTIAAPLHRLLKKETIWKWDKDCTSAMKKLKQALIEYPVLKVADPSLPFVVTTDASQYGIGVVLQQDDGNGYRPVEFMSARMSSEKVATSTYERELYALRQTLEHCKHYLLGRQFKVYSDHETLRWLKTQAKMTPKLTRWAAELDQHDFELKPVKGKYNVVADALSRKAD
ncbi:hypothetical protein CBR_g13038 [Chara braunii]|uniref:RNA-directed DNA polymerase n=1 Tax=Chara braunii TaxID=69332 RepID=A0A388KTF8_CHABU|nr:hypothetical protein CBR_g13038 [Chara braunii]|eukprot:GBG73319.1 hypothetical protein CBR_g13038 [Chara braunii]